MKVFNRQTGSLAEDMAVSALIKKGYEIIERNFSNRFGEIDIIAKDKEALVFVEVKSKIGTNWGSPEEMVNRNKLRRIKNMATIYMKGNSLLCRIDVIAIVFSLDNEVLSLTHYENVQL